MFFKKIMILLVILISTSCSSSKKVEKTKKEVDIRKEVKTDKQKEIDKIYFLNNKRYPFTSKYSQVIETAILENNTKSIHTKEYDFNSDGTIDMLMLFDKGELIKIISDLDFDNNYDVIDYYKNKHLVERQIINHINKKTYIWIHYDKNGKIIRKEMDTTLNGKVNQLFLYQNSILTEKRFDTNGDGKFDKIKHIKKEIKKDKDEGDK